LKKIKKGLTLVESLIAMTVAGTVATGVIINEREKVKENNVLNLMHDAMSIVYAVDHRIAIDGYEITNWDSTSWNNIDSIHRDLIKRELTSRNLSTCPGGGWNPRIIKEQEITLLECDLWESSPISNLNYRATLSTDSSTGLINGFNVTLSFDNENAFSENYQDMKYALNNYKRNEYQEITGQHLLTTVELSSGNELSSLECIDSPLNCGFRFTYDISGGNEKIRVDGNNSIINDHLDFIENTASTSPRQCLHWVEKINSSDGSKYWELQKDSNSLDCGIGIYEKTPVTADVLAENGSFRTVLLDKECNLLKLNGNKVEVDSGTTTPCGIMRSQDGSEIIQVVENTIATTALINDIFVEKGFINKLDIDVLTGVTLETNDLFAKTLNTKVVEIATEMNVNGSSNFKDFATFKKEVEFFEEVIVDNNLLIGEDLKVDGNVTFNNGINLHDVIIDGDLTINSTATFEKTTVLGNGGGSVVSFSGLNVNTNSLTSNEITINNSATSTTLMKAPTGDFDNINADLGFIDSRIAAMEFVNGYEDQAGAWENVGYPYGCISWTPAASTKDKGQRFTQTRACYQDQQKTIETYGKWYDSNGTFIENRIEETKIVPQTITITQTRSATGTKEEERLFYCNGRYIPVGSHCSEQNQGGNN
jgi:prepilin-type N-terminal cleavage/methylation domain-containing protein